MTVSLFALAQDLPPGYRYPQESDYSGAWQEFRASSPVPFHVQADFNGDSLLDDAWILLATRDKGWGLFVSLGARTGSRQVIALETDSDRTAAQLMGLSVVPPGRHRTACGKGYYKKCAAGEPEVLHLTLPAIDLFLYEGARSYFWWDPQARVFKRTWISD